MNIVKIDIENITNNQAELLAMGSKQLEIKISLDENT